MQRITDKHLEFKVELINGALNRPAKPWNRETRKANIGNFHISSAYGGVCLHEMANDGGGVHDVFSCGHVPKRELLYRMDAMLAGIREAYENEYAE